MKAQVLSLKDLVLVLLPVAHGQLDRELMGSIKVEDRANKLNQWKVAVSRVRTTSENR